MRTRMCACVHLSVSGAWYSGHGDVCMSMPTLQGHMEDMGRVVSVQGANQETINRHCDVQTRPWSHVWVRGAMEVTRIRCCSIISFINKNDRCSRHMHCLYPRGECVPAEFNANVCTCWLNSLEVRSSHNVFSEIHWQTCKLYILT